MLEGKVIDLTLDLEKARDGLEMERQRSLEALAKQAMELRKEREANESVGARSHLASCIACESAFLRELFSACCMEQQGGNSVVHIQLARNADGGG
jgi:hypothetical protein